MSRAVAGALVATTATLAAGSCAQPGSPPGGEIDRAPPRVVAVTPAPFDTVMELDAPAVIRFDERISERLDGVSEFQDAVLISPTTGEPRVDRRRSSLEIIPTGGWQPDRVYRVVVLPVFRDLFGNQREAPIELVFSTGAPIFETAMVGFVRDRLTDQPVADARVRATRRIDGSTYLAVSDTGGFFAMRFVPAGAYDLEAWADQDRDRTADFFEARDTAEVVLGTADTAFVELPLLPGDTTPARLARAEVVDSMKLRLVFDDYFAPGPVAGSAAVFLAPDTVRVGMGRLVHGARLDSILAAEEAARDSLAAAEDSLAADRDTAAVDSAEGGEALPLAGIRGDGARRGAEGAAEPDNGAPDRGPTATRPALPARELVLLLSEPLAPDTTFLVEVDGVVNIHGIAGGGGTAPFRTDPRDTLPVAPPPDTVPSDTVPSDTVPSDTVGPDAGRVDTIPADARRPGGGP